MKRPFFTLISISLGLVAGLTIAEITARIMYPLPDNLEGTTMLKVGSPPDFLPDVGTFPWRNSAYRHRVIDDFDNVVHFNNRGLRGPVIPYEKPAGEIRILFTGDSFVEAAQVKDKEAVYRALQGLFRENGLNVTVIGAGQSGWGTDQQYLYYLHEGYKYKPDIIIYQFITNDVTDNAKSHFGHMGKAPQYFDLKDGKLVRNYQPQSNHGAFYYALVKINRHLYLSSRLYSLIKNVWKGGTLSEFAAPTLTQLKPDIHTEPPPLLLAFQDPYSEKYEKAWKLTGAIASEWSTKAHNNGATLSIVYGPSHWAVHDWDEIPSTYPVLQQEFPQWVRNKPDIFLTKISGNLGIPFLSLTDTFRQCAEHTGNRYYFMNDGHWNADGHLLAAKSIYNWLISNADLWPDGHRQPVNRSTIPPC